MTGWRMGYGVWPESLVEGATRLAINCHSCVNAASQYAGIATIAGTSFGAYGEGYLRFSYANSVDNIRRALERMAEFLSTAKAAN